MDNQRSFKIWFLLLIVILLCVCLLNISLGSVAIPIDEVIAALTGNGASRSSWDYIILDYRLPKALTAIMAGGGLALSGLLMQTLSEILWQDPSCWD